MTTSDVVDDALRRGRPGGSLEQDHALAKVRARMFGRGDLPSLQRYELRRELGRGGASVVYAAYDPELQREVAIKLVQREAYGEGPDTHGTSRLLQEARSLAKLSHPNVVAVHDVGVEGDGDAQALFVVMELVRGEDLSQWRSHERTADEIVDVFIAAGRGLAAAHAAGIVHRDFKPGNVLVGKDGEVRVADFGLARAATDDARNVVSNDAGDVDAESRLTLTGGMLGTPLYMAPEQHAGETADARSDQFAFCASMLETLTDAPPFAGRTLEALADSKREAKLATPPPGVRVPGWLWRAIERGCAPQPDDRFPTMGVLLRALERGRRRRRDMAIGALVLGLGAAGVAATVSARSEGVCRGFEQGLAEVWDDTIRADVERAFSATELSYATQTFAKVDARLGDYAARWSTILTDTCTGDAAPDPEALARSLLCLERRRKTLGALTTVFREGDAATVERAVAAAARLPPVEACRGDAPTPDPPMLALDPAVDGRLLVAAALAAAGRYEESRAEVDAVSPGPTAGGETDDAVRARADYLRGELLGYANDFDAAHEAFRGALLASERAGDDTTATRAMIKLVLVVGNHLGRDDEAVRLAEQVRARLSHRPLLPGDTANLEHFVGLVHYAKGRHAKALERYRVALAIRIEHFGPAHPDVAETYLSIGAAFLLADQPDEAEAVFIRALDTATEVLGSEHPLVGHALGNLGYLEGQQGKHEQALSHQRRALAIHRAAVGESHVWIARSELNIGRTLGALERYEDAEDHLLRARTISQTLGDADRTAEVSIELGDQRLRRGDEPGATEAYEAAIAAGPAAAVAAGARFALARLVWPSAPQRARSLAEQARTESMSAEAEATADEIRQWLTRHPL